MTAILEDDTIVAFQAIARDITMQQEALNALQKSEEKFATIFKHSPDAIVIAGDDIGNQKPVAVNSAFSILTGYDEPTLLSHTIYELGLWVNQQDADHFMEVMQRDKRIRNFKTALRHKELGERIVRVSADMVELNDRPHLLSIVRDITEESRAQEDFRIIFEGAPIGISFSSIDMYFLRANAAFCNILGYTEEELRQYTFIELTHPDDRQGNLELDYQLLSGERSYFQLEKRYVHKDGHAVYADIHITLLRDASGKPMNFLAQVIDISKRKKAEQQAQKLAIEQERVAALRQLIGNISHDLRNPLSTIRMDIHLLTADPDNMPVYLESLKTQTDYFEQMLNDISFMFRLDFDHQLETEPINLEIMLHDLVRSIQPLITEKGIELRTIFEDNLPLINADSGHLTQAIRNVLLNAVDYTDEGYIRLQTSQKNDEIYLTIQDTGGGMTEEQQRHVFDRFYRGDPSRKTKIGGTGLGLAITRKVIEQHGGTIVVESQIGEGSKFTICLPSIRNSLQD